MRRRYRIEWDALDGSSGDEFVSADDAGAALGLVLDQHELDDREVVFTVEPVIATTERAVADKVTSDMCDLPAMPREVLDAVMLAGELEGLRSPNASPAAAGSSKAAGAGRRRGR